MNNTTLIYTGLTILYIVILVLYFLRRSKSHEKELTKFLTSAKDQVELHKQEASKQAEVKVAKAMTVVKKVQEAAELFEEKAQEEYEQMIQEAKTERREIIAQTKAEIEDLFKQAETEMQEYRKHRQQEIERNLVKMVIAVTEKVVETSLNQRQHKDLIYKALDEVKARRARS